MSLEVIDRHSESLFEFIWCPVCGHDVFSHIPFEGVFCKRCNTEVEIRESQQNAGYDENVLVDFDSSHAWNVHVEEKNRRDLPDQRARAKVVHGADGYEVKWWSPEPDEDWTPVEKGEFDDVDEPAEVAHLA